MNNLYTIFIIGTVVLLVAGYVQRWFLYKREFKAFVTDSIKEGLVLTSAVEEIEFSPENALATVLDRVEDTLSKMHMSYIKKNQAICAFSHVLARNPFRLIIRPSGSSALRLEFSDRLYIPDYMIRIRYRENKPLSIADCRISWYQARFGKTCVKIKESIVEVDGTDSGQCPFSERCTSP